MTYNFLWLVNRLCHKLNEVELTSTTFSSATGVYQDFMESVNAAISDIYQAELGVWPFAYTNTTFDTTIGDHTYSANASAQIINWDSFYIKKAARTPSSITSVGTTATVTDSGHPHVTGDMVYISGAAETDYNGTFAVTVTSSSQFTYTLAAATTSPATGTISIYPAYTTRKLQFIDYNAYLEEGYLNRDDEAVQTGQYGKPSVVVRTPDNNIIISIKPDRIYTVSYDYYAANSDLSAYSDVPLVPEAFKQVIVDGAIWHAYMFRDNTEEADRVEKKFKEGIDNMRRILIPQQSFMRIDPSIAN